MCPARPRQRGRAPASAPMPSTSTTRNEREVGCVALAECEAISQVIPISASGRIDAIVVGTFGSAEEWSGALLVLKCYNTHWCCCR